MSSYSKMLSIRNIYALFSQFVVGFWGLPPNPYRGSEDPACVSRPLLNSLFKDSLFKLSLNLGPQTPIEYQLRLGRQRQAWFIPLAGCAGKTVRSLENAYHK